MSHLGLLQFSLVMKPNSFYVTDIPSYILVQTNISFLDFGFQSIIFVIPFFIGGFTSIFLELSDVSSSVISIFSS